MKATVLAESYCFLRILSTLSMPCWSFLPFLIYFFCLLAFPCFPFTLLGVVIFKCSYNLSEDLFPILT
jgi:hypothetical protein